MQYLQITVGYVRAYIHIYAIYGNMYRHAMLYMVGFVIHIYIYIYIYICIYIYIGIYIVHYSLRGIRAAMRVITHTPEAGVGTFTRTRGYDGGGGTIQ